MIISMTGFGRGEASANGMSLTVEIKSVNSRYLDISLRLPQSLQDKELEIKELIQQHISRGKLNVNVRLSQTDAGEPGITLNERLVGGYKVLLEKLRETAGIEEPVSLRTLLQFSDIFESKEQDEETLELAWNLAKQAAQKAVQQLNQMRLQEGEQLENDLKERLSAIESLLDNIAELTEGRAGEIRDKLLERIKNLVNDEKIDPERLEMEVAILVDKMDITEEMVRLRSHIKFFREALEQDESMGRRLNFLSQEMNREINTIGSKANNSEISQYVVQAKESLEQIREQIQNIE